MKKLIVTLLICAIVAPVLSAFVQGNKNSFFVKPVDNNGSIKGTIYPADAAVRVKAINANVLDSVQADIKKGSFHITGLKTGNYTVDVYGIPPYKTVSKMNVKVTDGQTTDIGEIKLTGESE